MKENERRKEVVRGFFKHEKEILLGLIKTTIKIPCREVTKCYCNECLFMADVSLDAVKRLQKKTTPELTRSPVPLEELATNKELLKQVFIVTEPCVFCNIGPQKVEKIRVLVKYIPEKLQDLNLDIPISVHNHACQ